MIGIFWILQIELKTPFLKRDIFTGATSYFFKFSVINCSCLRSGSRGINNQQGFHNSIFKRHVKIPIFWREKQKQSFCTIAQKSLAGLIPTLKFWFRKEAWQNLYLLFLSGQMAHKLGQNESVTFEFLCSSKHFFVLAYR